MREKQKEKSCIFDQFQLWVIALSSREPGDKLCRVWSIKLS